MEAPRTHIAIMVTINPLWQLPPLMVNGDHTGHNYFSYLHD